MNEKIIEENILTILYQFINKYGTEGLITALKKYDSLHQVYICKTQKYIKRIPIVSINFIEAFGHDITIHTTNGTFKKYGTLKKEYEQFKKFGFVKCNQSFLIPIDKISEIKGRYLILSTGDKFTLSRSCATEVIYAYVRNNIERECN